MTDLNLHALCGYRSFRSGNQKRHPSVMSEGWRRVLKNRKYVRLKPWGRLVNQHIEIETMTVREPGDMPAFAGVPPSLESFTFRDFVRMANEMEMHPTSLLLQLAPQCESSGHRH